MPRSFLVVDRGGKARVTPFLLIDDYLPSCLLVLTMQPDFSVVHRTFEAVTHASISSPQLPLLWSGFGRFGP